MRDFYQRVVGWKASEVDMSGYADYQMHQPTTGNPVAGICSERGSNAQLPPRWLIYIAVENLEASIATYKSLGSRVIDGPRDENKRCVIQDPADVYVALYQA